VDLVDPEVPEDLEALGDLEDQEALGLPEDL
jgi:hypothetical protein